MVVVLHTFKINQNAQNAEKEIKLNASPLLLVIVNVLIVRINGIIANEWVNGGTILYPPIAHVF